MSIKQIEFSYNVYSTCIIRLFINGLFSAAVGYRIIENFFLFSRYLTATEWREVYGGKKAVNPNSAEAAFRRLPYDHCSLSLQPFENPVCDPDGHVFDLLAMVPYLEKFKTNPVTGKVCSVQQFVTILFLLLKTNIFCSIYRFTEAGNKKTDSFKLSQERRRRIPLPRSF